MGRGAKYVGRGISKGAKAVGGAAKGLGKSALKKIPGVGLVAGGVFAAHRLMKGDVTGALGELASGAASTVPGVGTAASVGIDAALMGRDHMKSKSQKGGDYIIRPGQEPFEFSADDTVIATKSKIPKGFSPAGLTAKGVGTAMMLGASTIAAPTNANLETEAGRMAPAAPMAKIENVLTNQHKDTGKVAQDFISQPGKDVKKIREGVTRTPGFWEELRSTDWKAKLKMVNPISMVKGAAKAMTSPREEIRNKPNMSEAILNELKDGRLISILGPMAGDINQMSRELPEAIASIEPTVNNVVAGSNGSPTIGEGSNIANQRDKHRNG